MILEYIWLDSQQQCRSKTKILKNSGNIDVTNMQTFPEWNYDGSSTGQATTEDSEIILRPVKVVKDPFRKGNHKYLVLCDTYNKDGTPNKFNTRHNANKIFVMKSRKIINSGNHSYLIENCDEYKSLYKKQLN